MDKDDTNPIDNYPSTTGNVFIYQLDSAHIDWCEENFVLVPHVAEFFNTISNLPFILVPPILAYLFKSYTRKVGFGAYFVFFLLFFVGIGSTYFHWTLSVIGQLVDQISILWVVMGGLAVWFPKRYLPKVFKGSRKLFQRLVMLPLTVIITALIFIAPKINAFLLLALAAPIVTLLIIEYRNDQYWRIRSLAIRCALYWIFALIFWANDKFLCDLVWYQFPYLHSGWHILIATSSYQACVLFAYFQVSRELLHLTPTLRYWPVDGGQMWDLVCIPYITVTNNDLDISTGFEGSRKGSEIKER